MVIRILVPDGINKTNRVNALQTPKSPIWMSEWLSCWKRYFLILKKRRMDEIQLCDPFHESSLPIISGSNSDLKGAQTFILNPSLVAAVATSLQYIPAPPLEGGYS